MTMDADTRIGVIIQECRALLPPDAMDEVSHFFEHGELEMAFEGLLLELMKADVVPPSYDYGEWCALAQDLGLNEDPVFDGHFWTKFEKWGKGKCR
jgi:hypothetical protein